MARSMIIRCMSAALAFSFVFSTVAACSSDVPNGHVSVATGYSGTASNRSSMIDSQTGYNSASAGNTSGSLQTTAARSNADTNNTGNIIIGVEYASPGMAATYGSLGISAVKYFPDEFRWDKMQLSQTSAINFAAMDKFIKEYQTAGFSDIVISLKTVSKWASINSITNYTPKPQFIGLFEKWVAAVVERYDNDGTGDMAGLIYPVNFIEVGIEFSSYEPEPAADYVHMLEHAYKAAHTASKTVKVLHSAFLTGLAFVSNPGPGSYEAAFAAVDKRIMFHSLTDIRKILDRPDIYDIANFHALCYPAEIEDTVKWLKYEMSKRGYSKPIAISDTSVNPFSGYGSALITKGIPSQLSILSPPAKPADRERLKTYFLSLINKNQTAINWVHSFCATDMVKKIVISAEQNIKFINTAFMEEFAPSKSMFFGAAAGNAIWSGITLTTVKPFTNTRIITEIRPAFYAIKQVSANLKDYNSIIKVVSAEKGVKIYKVMKDDSFFYIAWYEPDNLILPGDTVPVKSVSLSGLGATAIEEKMISAQGQTLPVKKVFKTSNGTLNLNLTYFPCYIFPG